MRLSHWVERRGRGALTYLSRKTGLAYSTVYYATYGGKRLRYDTARLISEATDGAVSVRNLCESTAHEAA